MVTFWLLIDTIAMIGSPADARSRPLGGMLGTGLAGRGVGGRSRSQRRQGGRGRERHNRGRCPSPDYLGGLGRRASICHAMSRCQGGIASKQTLRTGGWSLFYDPWSINSST